MKVLPRRRRAVLINSVLGVVVLAGAGGAYAAVHDDGGGSSGGSGAARVATVTKGTVLATVSGSGTLASPSDAGLNFTTGGTLTEVDVKPGDTVDKGEVLARVDPTAAKETLQEDEASLTAAQANLTKVEEGELPASTGESGSSGTGSRGVAAAPTPTPTPTVDPAQLAQAQAQLTQAQTKVDADERAVDGCVLKAPVSGTVASVGGAKGDTVSGTGASASGSGGTNSSASSSSSSSSSTSSTPTGFVVLTNPSGMQVTANFSESDALKIKAGQAATVTLNAESGTVLNAKVLSISSLPTSSGSSSGGGSGSSGSAVQYPATLRITSDTANLRTGLSASIQVVTGSASGALSVPTAAVTGTGANRTVLVVNKDGSTTRTNVTVGVEGDSTDQITSGLAEGQQVQIPTVASSGNGGFPGGSFPGGLGGGGTRFGGAGGTGGFRSSGLGSGGGRS